MLNVGVAFVIAGLLYVDGVNSYTYKDMTNLMNDLFNSTQYDKNVRPLVNQSDALQIFITQMLYYIEEVKLSSGDILTRSILFAAWQDDFMGWSPNDYGGIQRIPVPKDKIWTPDLVMTSGQVASVPDNTYSFLYLTYTGIVVQTMVGYFQTKCKVDLRYYPYDRHTCDFEFLTQHYTADDVKISIGTEKFLQQYTENNEWDVKYVTSRSIVHEVNEFDASVSVLDVEFIILRRPTFAIISHFVPTFLLSIMFPFASYIPPSSGERLSFLTTLLMAFVFLYTEQVDTMPRDAVHISYSSIAFIYLISLNTLSTVWNVFAIRVNTWCCETRPVPGCLQRLMTYRCKKSQKITDSSKEADDNDDIVEDQVNNDNKTDQRNLNWADVAAFLDKVAFIAQWLLILGISVANFYTVVITNNNGYII